MSSTIREADLGADRLGAPKVTPLPARTAANAPVSQAHGIARNPGMKLDLGFMESMRSVNRSALE
ncbi:MAG: deoxyribose-phosphate aldolase, partial [Mesorhizobium sp.]